MAEKKTETAPPSCIAGDDPEGGIFVTLPEAVRTNLGGAPSFSVRKGWGTDRRRKVVPDA